MSVRLTERIFFGLNYDESNIFLFNYDGKIKEGVPRFSLLVNYEKYKTLDIKCEDISKLCDKEKINKKKNTKYHCKICSKESKSYSINLHYGMFFVICENCLNNIIVQAQKARKWMKENPEYIISSRLVD